MRQFSMSPSARFSSPISPRRVSASRRDILRISKLPRAATIRAALHHSADARIASQPHAKDIVAEGKALIADGVKENQSDFAGLDLFGLDLRPHIHARFHPRRNFRCRQITCRRCHDDLHFAARTEFAQRRLLDRLLYTHPAHWTDELIQTIAECKKIARYVDMPLQHIHENMLERMRRETSQQYIVDLIKRIRAGVPGIALRTTFIVGFRAKPRRVSTHCSISSATRSLNGLAFLPIPRKTARAPAQWLASFRTR